MNNGHKLEREFVRRLNYTHLSDHNEKWQKHLKRMFPDIKETDLIRSQLHYDPYGKGDIIIQVRYHTVYLSIKTGRNPTMHCEHFMFFYRFLKDLGLDEDSLGMITMYHFGTAARFGRYKNPLSKAEIVEQYGDLIEETNKKINSPEIINKVIERSIIKGAQDERAPINYFYYGTLDKGLLISVDQIKQSILSDNKIHRDFIHFGQLVYQPAQRDRSKNEDYKKTTIHWPILTLYFYTCIDEDNILGEKRPYNPPKNS